MQPTFDDCFADMPAVVVLRGIKPEEALAVGQALVEAGLRIIEVPLNSPAPLDSIRLLAERFGGQCIIGAGTVLTAHEAKEVARAGGRVLVSPHVNPAVIRFGVKHELEAIPGWATATDAITACQAGARYLKLFPAGTYGEAHLKSVMAVLPPEVKVLAVGGVGAGNLAPWFAAGAKGVGVGTELYRPGDQPEEVHARAKALVAAVRACL